MNCVTMKPKKIGSYAVQGKKNEHTKSIRIDFRK